MEKKKLDMKIKIVLGIIIFIVVLFIGSFVLFLADGLIIR